MPRSRKQAPATSVADNAPRRPVRTTWIPITLDGYPETIGATMRINPPMREYEALGTDHRGVMRRLIIDWTLVDDNGLVEPIDDDLSGATDEELVALIDGWIEALRRRSALPKQNASSSSTGTPSNS